MNFPTDTVNVLPHLKELRDIWRTQDFRFTKDQQEQYDMLMKARRERVLWFYFKIGAPCCEQKFVKTTVGPHSVPFFWFA